MVAPWLERGYFDDYWDVLRTLSFHHCALMLK